MSRRNSRTGFQKSPENTASGDRDPDSDRRPAGASAHERRYSPGEELANSITHGAGAVLSIAATVALVIVAAVRSDALAIVAYGVFGFSMILLYTMSTVYHALSSTRARKVLEILDHSSIYVLIAGTYTAFSLTALRGTLGWMLFAASWGLAALGIVLKALWIDRFPRLSLAGYLAMGWLIVFAIQPLVRILPARSLVLLVAGGIAYSAGTVFYAVKKIKWFHPIWHLFVLAGTACHAFAALFAFPVP